MFDIKGGNVMLQAIQGKKSMEKPTLSFHAIFNCKVFGFLIIISLVLLFSSVMSHNVLAQSQRLGRKQLHLF